MTEYDAPHRTQTQILGDDIEQAMRNLRRDWPEMLPKGGAQVAPGWASRTGTKLADHDQRDTDMRRIDKIVSLRRFAIDLLNSWARVVVEDRGVTHHLPDGRDAEQMATFLERHAVWMSGHESAQDCRDELVNLSKQCHLISDPPRRESMSIGRCPLEVPGEQDVLQVCGGDVRSRIGEDERDGEAYASCAKCGEVAVASWWEDKMFDDPETRRWLTDADVVTFMHRAYGEVIAQGTVRQWVKRQVLVPSTETTDDGRRLFDRDAVVYAIDLHKRRLATR